MQDQIAVPIASLANDCNRLTIVRIIQEAFESIDALSGFSPEPFRDLLILSLKDDSNSSNFFPCSFSSTFFLFVKAPYPFCLRLLILFVKASYLLNIGNAFKLAKPL